MTESSGPQGKRRRMALHTKILIGMIVGVSLGVAANWHYSVPVVPGVENAADANGNGIDDRLDNFALNVADPIGRIFLRLVLMVVVPLVFSALVLGVLELGDIRRLGRVGVATLALTLILSLCAVMIGVTLVNVIRPGGRLSEEQRTQLQEQYASDADKNVARAKQAKPLRDTLLDMIPENPLQEMVGAIDGSSKGNGILAVMFFSVAVGVALAAVGERGDTLRKCLEGIFDVSMAIIGFAMRLAPFGVACLLFATTSRLGFDILRTLGWFVVTALLGMAIHFFAVYSGMIWVVGRRNPWKFFRDISDAIFTAFGTSSSNATLPTALAVAENKLLLPREVSRFVLTVGATGNQNGTALYEGVVVLFLAQVFGADLTLAQQIGIVLMSVLAGVGTAGVPGGSLPMIVVVLQANDIPGESIGIILGVDRVLDMCRTTLNVVGDLTLAACVARMENPNLPEAAAD